MLKCQSGYYTQTEIMHKWTTFVLLSGADGLKGFPGNQGSKGWPGVPGEAGTPGKPGHLGQTGMFKVI